MSESSLLDVVIGTGRVRLSKTTTGFQVICTRPKPGHESVAIERWRFLDAQGTRAATQALIAGMTLGEEHCGLRRQEAQAAARRAIAARLTMRPGSGGLKRMEDACVHRAVAYISEGRRLVTDCLRITTVLTAQGFPPEDLPIPSWMSQVLADPDEDAGGEARALI